LNDEVNIWINNMKRMFKNFNIVNIDSYSTGSMYYGVIEYKI